LKHLLIITLLATCLGFSGNARDLFWVGGTGDWNDGTHWSIISGGVASSYIPTALDDVYFDENSFGPNTTIWFSGDVACHNFELQNSNAGTAELRNQSLLGTWSISGDFRLLSSIKFLDMGKMLFISMMYKALSLVMCNSLQTWNSMVAVNGNYREV
jgi:hypothetical protein